MIYVIIIAMCFAIALSGIYLYENYLSEQQKSEMVKLLRPLRNKKRKGRGK